MVDDKKQDGECQVSETITQAMFQDISKAYRTDRWWQSTVQVYGVGFHTTAVKYDALL